MVALKVLHFVVYSVLYSHLSTNGYSALIKNKNRGHIDNFVKNRNEIRRFDTEWSDDAIGSDTDNATSFPVDILHDPRWHDFPSYNGTMDFTFTESASFSVSGQSKLKIFIHDYPYSLNLKLDEVEPFDQWIHYTLLLQNGNLLLYKNCDLWKNQTGIENENLRVIVKGANNTRFKKHIYQYQKWTNITPNSEESSNLTVYSEGESILTIRVNMCQDCYLKIKTPNGSMIYVDNVDNNCSRWHILNLTNNNGMNKFTFYRGIKLQDGSEGFWKVDTIISGSKHEEMSSFNQELAAIIIILLVILIFAVIICIISKNYFVTELNDKNEQCNISLIDNSVVII